MSTDEMLAIGMLIGFFALAVQSALNGRKDAGPEKMPWNSNDLATVCA